MSIYLPIAGMSVDVLVMLGVGAAVGFIAGMLGVGGGFLITPLLVVLGIPIDLAVATGANQAVATSASGALGQWQRGNVDAKMAAVLLAGSMIGSVFGVRVLSYLKSVGQIDLAVSLSYVLLLGVLGALMLAEGVQAMLRSRTGAASGGKRNRHTWVHSLPVRTRFHQSKLYMSLLPPFVLGIIVGLLGGVMGVGGGFFAVPVMVYVFGMPTRTVIGTSLLVVMATSALTTVLQAWQNASVDIVLAALLIVGGVIGAQLGVQAGHRLKAEQLRALLGLIVLAAAVRIGIGLATRPAELFSIDVVRAM